MIPIQLYRPSNGTVGESFISDWCGHCERDRPAGGPEHGDCAILAATMAYDIDDPKYPREWRIVDGEPVCTAFLELGNPVVTRCAFTIDMFDEREGLRQ